eukprot:scaffold53555_cov19-Prasinocladus_malaysianus.AAC.1
MDNLTSVKQEGTWRIGWDDKTKSTQRLERRYILQAMQGTRGLKVLRSFIQMSKVPSLSDGI